MRGQRWERGGSVVGGGTVGRGHCATVSAADAIVSSLVLCCVVLVVVVYVFAFLRVVPCRRRTRRRNECRK